MTELREDILINWKNIVELLAKVLDVSVVAITEHDNKYLKIVKTNKSDSNPFKDDMMPEMAGLYCESVIKSNSLMQIPNIKKDDYWKNNPLADNGLISYIGYPIVKKDGDIFGTLCVLDNKERVHSNSNIELIKEFKIILEKQLENIYLNNLTHSILDSLNSNLIILNTEGKICYTNKLWDKFCKIPELNIEHGGIGSSYKIICEKMNSESDISVCDGIKKVVLDELQFFISDYYFNPLKKWFRIKVTPFVGDGEYAVVVMHEDITSIKEVEQEMNKNRALFQQLFDKSPESIALLDVSSKIVNINNSFEKLFGFSAKIAIGKKLSQLVVPETEKTSEKEISKKVFRGETFKGEAIRKTKEGIEIFVDIVRYPIIMDGEISGAYAIYENITERKIEEERVKFLSFHDQLTELYNRRYFDNEIKRVDNERNLPISIIIGDLDKLKSINDSKGHGKGDEYIVESSKIIKSVVRKSDVVARIGGDEFAIILPSTDEITAKKIATNIQAKFYSENKKRELSYNISLGIATKTDLDTDLTSIIKIADNDMYKDKNR